MKHPPELKTKFLELRARGVSYGQIAEAIDVSKPTLIQWGKTMAEEIADLQSAEREFVREKLLGNFVQWVGRQVHHFNRLDEEFGRRQLKYSTTESVFRMMMASRKALDRYFVDDDRPRSRRDNGRAAAPTTSDSRPDHDHTLSPDSIDPQSEIVNPKSEMETPSCPPSLLPSLEVPENPAKTLPFPCQNSGVDNSNLSPATESHDATSADTGNQAHPQNNTGESSVAGKFISALPRLQSSDTASAQSEIVNPQSEIELDSESVPSNAYESTREWLERQGLKIPKGAASLALARPIECMCNVSAWPRGSRVTGRDCPSFQPVPDGAIKEFATFLLQSFRNLSVMPESNGFDGVTCVVVMRRLSAASACKRP